MPTAQQAQLAVKNPPELELGNKQSGAIRYIEHGCPHWRIRWHYHEEYELHFIAATRGKVFVGDYVGSFGPGSLFLTGPFVPHNWISQMAPGEECALRDQVVHFEHATIAGAAELIPELRSVLPFLERAKFGVEFHGLTDLVQESLRLIKNSDGSARFGHFCNLMDVLMNTPDQRLLSTSQIRLPSDETLQERVNTVVTYVMENYQNKITLSEVARLAGMGESSFSRFFHKTTGNRFSDFINRIRVSKACELLAHTDKYVTTICYQVGFNNVANFNRRFFDHKGMTPGSYRKQAQSR